MKYTFIFRFSVTHVETMTKTFYGSPEAFLFARDEMNYLGAVNVRAYPDTTTECHKAFQIGGAF